MHHASIRPRPVLARDWQPAPIDGTLKGLILHWTAGDYETVFPAYHFCLSGAVDVAVHATHELKANMRDLRGAELGDYAAHVWGRNSFMAGIAICAMRDATPHNFAAFPLTAAQIEALCVVAARLVGRYSLPIAMVRTHAEAAVDDGYFGSGAQERWDIARLAPSSEPLADDEPFRVGEQLRARIGQLCA